MRVAFLSYAPAAGGVTTFQALNIGWLQRQGVQVTLIDEDPGPTLASLNRASDVDVVAVRVWTAPRKAAVDLDQFFGTWKPDVIHTSNPGLLALHSGPLRRARGRGARIVLTHHSEILVPTVRRSVMALASSLMLPAVADEVTYVSAYTRRWWERRFPWLSAVTGRITPNGVPPGQNGVYRAGPATPLRVGFVGRLSREKGVERFLEVAETADPQRFSFLAFGDGEERATVQASRSVAWRGHHTDPALMFGEIDLLLMTSPVENCPFAVLEARASGVPAVAAAVGGLPELITPGVDGVLVPRCLTSDLLNGLARAAERWASLSVGCRLTSVRWSLDAAARRLWGPYLESERRQVGPIARSNALQPAGAGRSHVSW